MSTKHTPGTTIRQRFEQWAVANGWSIKRGGFGGPKYPDDTQCAWRGFQAAAEDADEQMLVTRDLLAALRVAHYRMPLAHHTTDEELAEYAAEGSADARAVLQVRAAIARATGA